MQRYQPLFEMAKWGTNNQVVENFVESSDPIGTGPVQAKNIRLEKYGEAVGLINYSTLIALKVPTTPDFVKPFKIIVNMNKYSVTTSKITRYILDSAKYEDYVIEEMNAGELKQEAYEWERGNRTARPQLPAEFGAPELEKELRA